MKNQSTKQVRDVFQRFQDTENSMVKSLLWYFAILSRITESSAKVIAEKSQIIWFASPFPEKEIKE